MISIASILPNAEDLLELEPEELAGFVLEFLNALPDRESGQLNRYNFTLFSSPSVQAYPEQYRERVAQALTEAWVWLEREGLVAPKPGSQNDWVFITRRGRRLLKATEVQDYRKQQQLPRYLLHPSINQKVWPSFLRGEYDTAVFLAFKEVEVAVRTAGGFAATDIGVRLIRAAFDPSGGPLADSSVPEPEREATAHLFAGAIGLYKNPHSHRAVAITDPTEAIHIILLASHLLRIVDQRTTP